MGNNSSAPLSVWLGGGGAKTLRLRGGTDASSRFYVKGIGFLFLTNVSGVLDFYIMPPRAITGLFLSFLRFSPGNFSWC